MSVAIVTGGGGEIGRAIALALAPRHDAVAVVDRDAAAGEATVRAVEEVGGQALFLAADVSSPDDVVRYVAETESRLGPITAFANNAGIEGVIAPIHLYPDDVFETLQSVNVTGVFLGLKYVLARMMERGEGAIVNTASTSSIRGRAGLAGYVASKHGVLGLTRVAALDVAGTKIRVNAVMPGPIETRMIRSLNAQGGVKRANAAAPLGTPAQVASVVSFLLSPEASHVNGAAWTVDGGATIA